MLLDPRTIMVAIPCGDGRLMAELTGNLIAARNMFAAITLPSECSIVQVVRNSIANGFLKSNFQWLVSIDSDTVPSPEDFRLLLEPKDERAPYWTPEAEAAGECPPGAQPEPSRIMIPQLKVPEPGQPLDFTKMLKASADALVVCEYSYKNDTLEPVKLGFGFVRIHRSVFSALQRLTHPKNPDSEAYEKVLEWCRDPNYGFPAEHLEVLNRCRPDAGGGPRLWQGAYKGETVTDYFPTGPQLSTFLPNAQWKGEDHGFFMLCHMAGIIPRIETRTRLTHIGRKGYPYMGPDYGGGQ